MIKFSQVRIRIGADYLLTEVYMAGLFYEEELKGKCKCSEHSKPIEDRQYTYYAYYCLHPWGKAKNRYDNRKLLRVTCNKCRSTWVEYNPRSKYWNVIQDDPYAVGETLTSNRKKTIIDKLKEKWKVWQQIWQ